jgi:predicted metal-binding protein
MLDMEALATMAAAAGFTHSAPLDVATLELKDEVRAMCSANTCRAYGKNWSCPPACGELDELRQKFARYSRGILVQTVGEVEDSLDFEGMMEAEAAHKEHFAALHEKLLETWPGLLALGAGTCTRCKACTYPDAPCRFPDRRVSSMEACGLVVMDTCKANGLGYYYGPRSIAYTSCFLLE